MAGPSVADAALSVGSKIGRYFSLVSMLPALLFVVWVRFLFLIHAWTRRPDAASIGHALTHWPVSDIAQVLLATLVLALFIHPLQFANIQMLEGYWGNSTVARMATTWGVMRYRKRLWQLHDVQRADQQAWEAAADAMLEQRFQEDQRLGLVAASAPGPSDWDEETLGSRRDDLLNSNAGDVLVSHVLGSEAGKRSLARYPDAARMMPTRLGNTLRRFEDAAGRQYGLDAIAIAPHLSLVAPEPHLRYMQDCRQQLDTTVRLCTVSLLASVVSAVVLLRDGGWLFVALVPYALAYIAYRGAVASADDYATAVTTVIDLDRFLLYKELHLDTPRDTAEERVANRKLLDLLGGRGAGTIRYERERSQSSRQRSLR